MLRRALVYVVWTTLLALCLAGTASARQRAQGWCEQGNAHVTVGPVGGFPVATSIGTFQQSFPQCTVTVYLTGTLVQPSFIYSDNSGTVLANPFPAGPDGRWEFYADNGRYDVQFSGAGITTPFTVSDIYLSDASSCLPGVICVDGATYPRTAAGINSALIAGSSVDVGIPGSYCDTTINLPSGHYLQFGDGTYQVNIVGADSTTANVTWAVVGAGRNQTILQACPSSAIPVLTTTNFSTLTGGTNFYGVFNPEIRGWSCDGNNTAPSCIALYGRALQPKNIWAYNSVSVVGAGIWLEWGGTESDTSPGTSPNGQAYDLESDFNAGAGFIFKGITGATNSLSNLVGHNNGTWGVQTSSNIILVDSNFYENPSGGCDVQSGGSFQLANSDCDAPATGWGLLLENGSGNTTVAGGNLAGGIPFEIQGTGGAQINTVIANASGSNPCVKINGGGNIVLVALSFNCPTMVAFTSELTASNITMNNVSATTLYSGSPATTDTLSLFANAGTSYYQFGGSVKLASPVINGTPTGTGIHTIIVKKGTGSGTDYTTASTSFTPVDGTNLAYATTIPIGWKLAISVTCVSYQNTGAAGVALGILDGSSTLNRVDMNSTINVSTPAALQAVITGDGASHTIQLEFATLNGSDSALLKNSTTGDVPTMIFTLTPAN